MSTPTSLLPVTRGKVFGLVLHTRQDEHGRYYLVVHTSDLLRLRDELTLLLETGQGLEIEYGSELDQLLREAIDTLADIREHAPGFGQLRIKGL